jgi:membrane protein
MTSRKKSEREERGRQASKPGDIPAPGWRDILLRVKNEQKKDNLSIVAAGVAFYLILAIFPALAAMVSIYGLVADPADVQNQLGTVAPLLPPEAYRILDQQLTQIVSGSGGALGLGVVLGIILALWSAAKGMKAMITALNIAYDEEEGRGFFKLNALALLLTLGGILFVLVTLGVILALPALLEAVGLPGILEPLVNFLRWPLLAGCVMVALALLYRFAPNRDRPRWHWVSAGSVVATLLWIAVSALFSVYVSRFGNYNETYGSMGAVIILLMWFFLTAYMFLLGAELNAEMEHQTREDTTSGEPTPMGKRGARMADTLGPKP